MTDLKALADKINELRENMNELVVGKGYLIDTDILKVSEELDELVNLYMRQMIIKNESVLLN
jgi:hypothetical protein